MLEKEAVHATLHIPQAHKTHLFNGGHRKSVMARQGFERVAFVHLHNGSWALCAFLIKKNLQYKHTAPPTPPHIENLH
jgi:hypothetical protein